VDREVYLFFFQVKTPKSEVDLPWLTFKLSLGFVFNPHHVNQGGVQKTTPQVTLYKSYTDSLSGDAELTGSKVLVGHPDRVWELLLVLFPLPPFFN
jgi:hypothetical protein